MTSPMEHSRRDPVKTRQLLLESAHSHIHRHGYQAASLDAILQDTGVTKGALYHHFPNKTALGYAVVDEVMAPHIQEVWIEPLIGVDDPLSAFQHLIKQAGDAMTAEELILGCPLNNLAQEMSPLDEGFRQRLSSIYENWQAGIVTALEHGKQQGTVRNDVENESVAAFLVASLEGCIGMAKNAQDMTLLQSCGLGVLGYLDSLKPAQRKDQ